MNKAPLFSSYYFKTVLIWFCFFVSFLNAQNPTLEYNQWITNNTVQDIAEDGNYLYAGGDFSYVGPPTGSGAKMTLTSAFPDLGYCRPNGTVNIVIPDGAGGWFIGGNFSYVATSYSSSIARSNLAHILSGGALDLAWNPTTNAAVNELLLSGSDLFVAGTFTNVNGQPRNRLAKLSASSGTLDTNWDPNAGGPIYAMAMYGTDIFVGGAFSSLGGQNLYYIGKVTSLGTGSVDASWNVNPTTDQVNDLLVVGNNVYAAGKFTTIGNTLRSRLAKITCAGTGTVDGTWNPGSNGEIYRLAYDGTNIYAGGYYTGAGGQSRNNLAKLDTTGGAADANWNPNPSGPVQALCVSGTDLYASGQYSFTGSSTLNRAAKISTAGNGTIDISWAPNGDNPVYSIAIAGSDVYLGGYFLSMGGSIVNRLARFDKLTGAADLSWTPNPDNSVLSLATDGSNCYAGGTFTSIGGLSRNRLAKISTAPGGTVDASWAPSVNNAVWALYVLGTDLYVGGNFTSISFTSRNRIARLSTQGSGTLDAIWNPNSNGSVYCFLPYGNSMFVGGFFSSIGGQSPGTLAKLSMTGTGAADPTYTHTTNSWVFNMALSGTDLYVCGGFTLWDSYTRTRVAKLSVNGGGSVDAVWNPSVNATAQSAVSSIIATGNDVFIGGLFSSVGGQNLKSMAKLNASGTGTADPSWNYDITLPFAPTGVHKLIRTTQGIYVAGEFWNLGNAYPKRNLAFIGTCTLPNPPVSTSATNVVVCVGQTTTLTASGGPNINWYSSLNSGTVIGTGTSIVTPPVPNTAGPYTFYIGTENSCGQSLSRTPITITINAAPVLTVNSGAICLGGTYTINPSGATSYSITGNVFTVSPTTTTAYTVTGTSTNVCVSADAIVTVTVNTTPTISVNNYTVCSGNSVAILPTGANSYTITGGNFTVSPSSNSTYSITGSNAGCPLSNLVTSSVFVNTTPTVIASNTSICLGNAAVINPNGGSSYTISGNTFTVNPITTTAYSISTTATNNCISALKTITVTVNSLPTITVNNATICEGSSVTLVPGGAATYTITGNNFVVSPLNSSSYSVAGTSVFGCVSASPAVANVVVNPVPTISVNSSTICSGEQAVISPSGAVSYSVTGNSFSVSPVTNTSYSVVGIGANGCKSSSVVATILVNNTPTISVSNLSICAGATAIISPSGANTYSISGTSFTVSPSVNTSYTIAGTGTNGCLASNVVMTVSVNPLPFISVNSGSICAGQNFSIMPSGASTYTYSGGTNVVSPTTNTFYSVTGTSAEGCLASNTAVANVSVSSLPVVSVNSGSLCSGQTFTLSPVGAVTYTISGGSALVAPSTNTSYLVMGTNSDGCTASAVANLTVYATPVITVSSGTICNGQAYSITATGGLTYTYSSGSNLVSPATTTFYLVNGTSAQGCVSANTATSTVTVYSLPVISVNSGSMCLGQNFTLVPTGALTYTYSGGANVISPSTNTFYTVSGTSGQGCTSAYSASANITVYPLPTVSVNSGSICAGGSFSLVPTGGVSYTFSGGSSNVSPANTSTYLVTASNLYGCTATAVSQVTVYALPVVTVNSGTICTGQTFTIIPSGANTYSYSSGSAVVSPLTNTFYTVSGLSAEGCSSATTAVCQVSVNLVPTITVNSGSICAGQSFTLIAGGASTYTYSGGSNVVTPFSSSSYSVAGTSAEGCISSSVAVSNVTVYQLPIISVNSGSLCYGESFTLAPSGAASYTFSGGTAIVNPSVSMSYSVYGTSTDGCASALPAVSDITVQSLPVIVVNSGAICVGQSFTIVPSGANSYTYSGGSNVVNPLSSSLYSVSGTNAEGCLSASPAIVSVSVNPLPVISISTSNTIICDGESLNLVASGASSYTWSDGSQQQVLTVSPTDTSFYSVNGTDINGCENTASVVIISDECLGVQKFDGNDVLVQLYPNPNAGEFIIRTSYPMELNIVNAVGQVILNSFIGNGETSVALNEKAKGIYFVELKRRSVVKRFKVVVN